MCKQQEAAHISLPSMLVQQQQVPGGGSGSSIAAVAVAPLPVSGLEPLAEEGEEEEGEQGQAPEQAWRPPRPPSQQHQVAAAAPGWPHSNGGSGGGEAGGAVPAAGSQAEAQWVWRTNLEDSMPFWEGWYLGLSDAFLLVPVPKVRTAAGGDVCGGPRRPAARRGGSRALPRLRFLFSYPHPRCWSWWAPTAWTAR